MFHAWPRASRRPVCVAITGYAAFWHPDVFWLNDWPPLHPAVQTGELDRTPSRDFSLM